jgi:hypothetical protein
MACTKLQSCNRMCLRPIAGGIALRTGAGAVFTNFGGKCCGMDQGSEFEGEFRARRIRVRGSFAHKSLTSEIIHGRCTPVRDARL